MGDFGEGSRERRGELLALVRRVLDVPRSANLVRHHAEEAVVVAEVPIRGQSAVYAETEDGADGNGDG